MPPAPNTAYLLLGANLGDRAAAFQQARTLLERHGTVLAASALYETDPWGGTAVAGQPPYLNQVLALHTLLDPFGLLRVCQYTEISLGREHGDRWQARTLDVDILLFGGVEMEFGDELILPHPRLAARRFALVPLHELAPDLLVPGRPRRTVAELLAACPDEGEVLKCEV
ncbi:MAG: 2-amino-4-hydroxy-6-hydroxymethyldihydropteridine diphosphokinase [Hymenobacteraceae bacterium]|nr:2-amino-4-hydroxy-6-hydroxymethyldihydropteridine diphosphokinase [Hymenobacteraceae bacterium]